MRKGNDESRQRAKGYTPWAILSIEFFFVELKEILAGYDHYQHQSNDHSTTTPYIDAPTLPSTSHLGDYHTWVHLRCERCTHISLLPTSFLFPNPRIKLSKHEAPVCLFTSPVALWKEPRCVYLQSHLLLYLEFYSQWMDTMSIVC